MKVISYSLFGDVKSFEFPFYLRGLYFNLRMNKLIYPDWYTVVHISRPVYNEYELLFTSMLNEFKVIAYIQEEEPLCKAMLWRMHPIFYGFATHVLCRDADALTSYREAQSVNLWIQQGQNAHVIHDNPSHGGLMGGLVGFKSEVIRNTFKSFDNFIDGWDLSKRGSDQDLLNKRVLPLVKDRLYTADLQAFKPSTNPGDSNPIPGVDKRLWESNLCSAFIGSAGVNDFETLRFFKRFDKTDYSDFEKQFKNIFYWA